MSNPDRTPPRAPRPSSCDEQLNKLSADMKSTSLGSGDGTAGVVLSTTPDNKKRRKDAAPPKFDLHSADEVDISSFFHEWQSPNPTEGTTLCAILQDFKSIASYLVETGFLIRPRSSYDDQFDDEEVGVLRSRNATVYFLDYFVRGEEPEDIAKCGRGTDGFERVITQLAKLLDKKVQTEEDREDLAAGEISENDFKEQFVTEEDYLMLKGRNLFDYDAAPTELLKDVLGRIMDIYGKHLKPSYDNIHEMTVDQGLEWQKEHGGLSVHHAMQIRRLDSSYNECQVFGGVQSKRGQVKALLLNTIESACQLAFEYPNGAAHEMMHDSVLEMDIYLLEIAGGDLPVFKGKLGRLLLFAQQQREGDNEDQGDGDALVLAATYRHAGSCSSWEPGYQKPGEDPMPSLPPTLSIFDRKFGQRDSKAAKYWRDVYGKKAGGFNAKGIWDPFITSGYSEDEHQAARDVHVEAISILQKSATQEDDGSAAVVVPWISLDECKLAYKSVDYDLHDVVKRAGYAQMHQFVYETVYYRLSSDFRQVELIFVHQPFFNMFRSYPIGSHGPYSATEWNNFAKAAVTAEWDLGVSKFLFGRATEMEVDRRLIGGIIPAFGGFRRAYDHEHSDSQMSVAIGKAMLHGHDDDVQPLSDKYGKTTESLNQFERNNEDGGSTALTDANRVRLRMIGYLSNSTNEDATLERIVEMINDDIAKPYAFVNHPNGSTKFVEQSSIWKKIVDAWNAQHNAKQQRSIDGKVSTNLARRANAEAALADDAQNANDAPDSDDDGDASDDDPATYVHNPRSVLPASCWQLLRRTKIWINRTYSYGPAVNPTTVHHTTTHHYSGWLLCVRDRQEKEESIEIYNAAEYQRMRLHYQSYGLLLHEFCHIVHQKALPGGLYNSAIVDIHRIAKESGKYAKVLRRDWALKEVDTDMAYAIVDHKEFFAEISVSFLADFYHELDRGAGAATSMSMATCSPPFVSPAVIERMRQQYEEGSQSSCSGRCRAMSMRSESRIIIPHCSKFFPFTKGQLRRYDPRVYKCFVKLWQCIEGWEDPAGQRCYSCEWF